MRKPKEVPIWERALLTVEEAADYTGIGINRLRSISQNQQNGLILYVGSKRGSAMSSVSLSKELADDIRSAVLLTLRSKLIDLKEKYDKL